MSTVSEIRYISYRIGYSYYKIITIEIIWLRGVITKTFCIVQ